MVYMGAILYAYTSNSDPLNVISFYPCYDKCLGFGFWSYSSNDPLPMKLEKSEKTKNKKCLSVFWVAERRK